MTRKKTALIALAAGLALGLGLLAFLWYWSATSVTRDPVGAAQRGMDRVMDLPDPLSLGFLGVVEAGERAWDCSGTALLETTAEGLRFYVTDCTVGDETETRTFWLYADPTQAAALLDGVWRGVELTRPLADQAVGTGYETLYSEDQRDQAQTAADALRDALAAVTALDFAPERQALADFMAGAQASATKLDDGWDLAFHHFDTDLTSIQPLAQALDLPPELLGERVWLELNLNGSGAVTSLALLGQNLQAQLDLGSMYPQRELSPRLEAQWTGPDGQSWSVTLAFTVDRGKRLVPPAFENALALLGG